MKRKASKILLVCMLFLSFFVTGCEELLDSILESIEQEEETSLFESGYITSELTTIETEHFIVKIDPNVYVAPNLEENLEGIYDALEHVSGLKFYNERYGNKKITIDVAKSNNAKFPESEFGSAYAYSTSSRIHITSGDLLLGNSYALTHELSHILQFSQSHWAYDQVYGEGFAQYNAYKANKYLEETNIQLAKTIEQSDAFVGDMSIYGDLYSQSIEYWIQNYSQAYDISFNGGYSVGFRFMSYLDDTYGNYTDWIHYYENKRPKYANNHVDQKVIMSEQLNAMTMTYGKDVFDNFYGWMRANEESFISLYDKEATSYDLTELDKTYIYPQFTSVVTISMNKYYIFKYDNLYIDLEETKNYLSNYKNKDISNLKLVLEKEVNVEFYDKENNLIESKFGKSFDIANVSYIKLVGQNTLGSNRTHGLSIEF